MVLIQMQVVLENFRFPGREPVIDTFKKGGIGGASTTTGDPQGRELDTSLRLTIGVSIIDGASFSTLTTRPSWSPLGIRLRNISSELCTLWFNIGQ